MNSRRMKELIGWGFALWLIGYVLGIILFALVKPAAIGWIILPVGVAVTWWVLLRRVKSASPTHYLMLAVVWTSMAIALDYFLIVRAFHPADGYYKPDVYLYYALTFLLPLAAVWRNKRVAAPAS